MDITYGLKVKPKNDPFIAAAEKGVSALLEAGIPGTYLVDSIPILRHIPSWIPGADFKRKGREWRENTNLMVEKPFAAFLDNLVRHPHYQVVSLLSLSLVYCRKMVPLLCHSHMMLFRKGHPRNLGHIRRKILRLCLARCIRVGIIQQSY